MGFPDFGLEIEIGGYKKIEFSLELAFGLATGLWLFEYRESHYIKCIIIVKLTMNINYLILSRHKAYMI